ncbi:MAG: YgiQ family radical SAM protein [Arcobacteraceae bacterium]|nr:YgiQ family radical SAM protein [Arcobacteraceae bacterium]MDY0365656.1 YgiQ family radical SAM protein [Arcobacteraceae bacterium]
MFLPTTKEELEKLNIKQLDIILVSGDTYIDSPYSGIAIIGNVLHSYGYKVGIIAQPDINSDDITRLGEPRLFWGVSAGLVDSMVANYTANKKRRNNDDFTPNGINNRRPDRASIVYTGLIRRYFKNTVPIVLGGIEASLRRVAHYDFWGNNIRKSLLFDAKADILLYGMAEKTIIKLANSLNSSEDYRDLRGVCYISKEPKDGFIELDSYDDVKSDKIKFINSFHTYYKNSDPITAKGLMQKQDSRYLIQNPPEFYLSENEIDSVYDLHYERDVHPFYKKQGFVRAMETIKYSITTHHGCYGECNFCAISVHQGRTIRSRSEKSILKEVVSFTKDKNFKGIISDIGGATANMYGFECDKKLKKGDCSDKKRCLGSDMCEVLKPNHKRQIDLLREIRNIKGVKKVFVNSGIRYDLINEDKLYGQEYLKEIVTHHVSGQMKIAPEHSEEKILSLMGKPNKKTLLEFKAKFDTLNKQLGKKQFLTYYMIAAHPGSSQEDMNKLKEFANKELKLSPEQVQIFTPTPSTYSTLMYYTGLNPWTYKPLFVEKDPLKKQKQKEIVVGKSNCNMKRYKKISNDINL